MNDRLETRPADGPDGTPDAAGMLHLNCEWTADNEPVQVTLDQGPISRDLGTIASVDFEGGASTYVLNGRLCYELSQDGRVLKVHDYSGSGVPIDGLDRGSIAYASQGDWTGPLDEGGRFAITGDMVWTDSFNEECLLQVILQGTVLANRRIAYLNTRIHGLAHSGEALPARVLVDVPALM